MKELANVDSVLGQINNTRIRCAVIEQNADLKGIEITFCTRLDADHDTTIRMYGLQPDDLLKLRDLFANFAEHRHLLEVNND